MKQIFISPSYTDRTSNALDKYLNDVNKEAMISVDEEVNLARRIRTGDQKALGLLVKANLRFVISVAKQYQGKGLPLTDLISEGNLGLIKAAEKFDESRGFKFISYAVWWIRQSIIQGLNQQSRSIRLPLNRITELVKLSNAKNSLEQSLEREPSKDELSHMLGIKPGNIAFIESVSSLPVSLDSPLPNAIDFTLLDTIEDQETPGTDSILLNESTCIEMEDHLSKLNATEKAIVMMYFGLNKAEPADLTSIGLKFNLTAERIRQIKNQALKKLKRSIVQNSLMESREFDF